MLTIGRFGVGVIELMRPHTSPIPRPTPRSALCRDGIQISCVIRPGPRSDSGLAWEGAQVVLGHSRADVTQVYAERDHSKAAAFIAEIG